MSPQMRVFCNERPADVAAGATVREVILAVEPTMLDALLTGRAFVTDGVGRALPLDQRLTAGAILRVRRTARGQGPSA